MRKIMKVHPFGTKFVAAVLISVSIHNVVDAQMVTYKTVKDDPKDLCNFMIAIDPIGMDIGLRNMDGGSLLGLGINGYATIKERLGVETRFQLAYFSIASLDKAEKIRRPMWFEAGGFLNLTDKNKNRMMKVVLSSTKVGNTTYTKSLTVPGTLRKLKGVRGGIVTHTFPLKAYDSYDGGYLPEAAEGYVNASVTGIYAGIQGTKVRNLFINTDSYGMCGNTGMTRWYIDVLMFPLWTAGYSGTSYKDSLTAVPVATPSNPTPGEADMKKYNPLGWRYGIEMRPAEIRRRKSEGRAMGIFIKIELGQRPIEGAFVYMACGFTILRKKMSILGYKKPESEQNTFE